VKIHSSDYVTSAPSLKECPDFQGTPELVLVGRSNVGKSSFINSMTQRKNLARTSNTPGKTRYINFYTIVYARQGGTDKLMFVDLPGYGYAKISKAEQEKWRQNLEAYLGKRQSIRLVIQMIDGRHGPQNNDIQMHEWLQFHGRQVQVVLTKIDKLSKNEIAQSVALTARLLDVTPADVIAYSAETHLGRDKAWQALLAVLAKPAVPFEPASDDDPDAAEGLEPDYDSDYGAFPDFGKPLQSPDSN
jgi:GTP-binding protein